MSGKKIQKAIVLDQVCEVQGENYFGDLIAKERCLMKWDV